MFRVGQKVVSLVSGKYLKKGQVYTVMGIESCSCGDSLDVGLRCMYGKRTVCPRCGPVFVDGPKFFIASFFRPLDPLEQQLDEIEKEAILELELA
jgi:hypothetical protein